MKINYSGDAFESLCEVVNYIESVNTHGAGVRWLGKFEAFLVTSLNNAHLINLCNNQAFYLLQLRCLNFNDWVVAYSINNDAILIEAILHRSRLID